MNSSHLAKMEAQATELNQHLQHLASAVPVSAMVEALHKPGPTETEQAMLAGILESMVAHTKVLSTLHQVFTDNLRRVTLNPQPLPPAA